MKYINQLKSKHVMKSENDLPNRLITLVLLRNVLNLSNHQILTFMYFVTSFSSD